MLRAHAQTSPHPHSHNHTHITKHTQPHTPNSRTSYTPTAPASRPCRRVTCCAPRRRTCTRAARRPSSSPTRRRRGRRSRRPGSRCGRSPSTTTDGAAVMDKCINHLGRPMGAWVPPRALNPGLWLTAAWGAGAPWRGGWLELLGAGGRQYAPNGGYSPALGARRAPRAARRASRPGRARGRRCVPPRRKAASRKPPCLLYMHLNCVHALPCTQPCAGPAPTCLHTAAAPKPPLLLRCTCPETHAGRHISRYRVL